MKNKVQQCLDYIERCNTLEELAGADIYCNAKLHYYASREEVNRVKREIINRAIQIIDAVDRL